MLIFGEITKPSRLEFIVSLLAKSQASLNKLAPDAKHLLLAVSGGADSMAMLFLFKDSDYQISIAHFDHSLRPNSAEDCKFVEQICKTHGLSFLSEKADVAKIAKTKGWNIEDAARRLRYGFLTRAAKTIGAEYILTGHNQNDQAETVLMQVLRGAAYLKGMQAKQGQILRPLLDIKRSQLEAFLASIGQNYLSDQTNFDIDYARAYLRHNTIPELSKRYPKLIEKLAKLAYLQQDIFAHDQKEAKKLISNNELVNQELIAADKAISRQAIAELLNNAHALNSSKQVDNILNNLANKSPIRIDINKEYLVRIAYGKTKIISKKITKIPKRQVKSKADLPSNIKEDILVIKNLVYRSKKAGDYIQLSFGKKKLSDIFINKKIPQEDRTSIKLLAAGQEVFWIENIAANPEYEIKTINYDKKFMKLALEQAKLAYKNNELPVGAVVVKDNKLIAKAHNQTEKLKDPSAHAEVLAIKQAAKQLNDWRLSGCILYVTLEPCPMCFGTSLQAHLAKIVYGAKNIKEGALSSVVELNNFDWKRKIEIKSGVLAKESTKLLQDFFKDKR